MTGTGSCSMPTRAATIACWLLAAGCTFGIAETGTRPMSTQPASPAPQGLVRAALADAARVSGRPQQTLVVIDAEAVTWPDGAAGCPEPGMGYTQALVPGYRIRIRAGNDVLNYHATEHSRVPVLCPASRVQPPLPAQPGSRS